MTERAIPNLTQPNLSTLFRALFPKPELVGNPPGTPTENYLELALAMFLFLLMCTNAAIIN